jgi:hypothetical protein
VTPSPLRATLLLALAAAAAACAGTSPAPAGGGPGPGEAPAANGGGVAGAAGTPGAPAVPPSEASVLRSGTYLRIEEMTKRWAFLGSEAGPRAEEERAALESAIAREVMRDLDGVLADLADASAPMWRRSAVRGLGFVRDARVRPALEAVLDAADVRLRNDALVSLARIGDPATSVGAEDRALALLSDADAEVRGNAALCLSRIWKRRRREGREPVVPAERAAEAEAALLPVIVDPEDPVVRSQAAAALGALGSEGAEEALVNATRDPDAFVRLGALYGLAACGTTRIAPALVESLDRESGVNLRAAAALALGAVHERAGRSPPLGELGMDAARWRAWLAK